jgi:hypothetical protein
MMRPSWLMGGCLLLESAIPQAHPPTLAVLHDPERRSAKFTIALRNRSRLARAADLPVAVLERDHIAACYSNPLGGHGWSAARHVPSSVGLAEGTF